MKCDSNTSLSILSISPLLIFEKNFLKN